MSSIVKIVDEVSLGFVDYPDPESHSLNLFVYGCKHRCIGCSNPELWSRKFGISSSYRYAFRKILESSVKFRTTKVCIFGGDPLFSENIDFTRELLLLLESNDFDVCLYTGYSIATVKRLDIRGFRFVKVGKFDITKCCVSEKTDEYIQFASSNQQLYDSNFKLLSTEGRYYFNKK